MRGQRLNWRECLFLSTLSLRRATGPIIIRVCYYTYFYPRSPCGERPHQYLSSDFWGGYFYPRSPCGERLTGLGVGLYLVTISIHALLAESDAYTMTTTICIALFLSTLSLRRATNRFGRPIDVQLVFLSTLSLRRATRTL